MLISSFGKMFGFGETLKRRPRFRSCFQESLGALPVIDDSGWSKRDTCSAIIHGVGRLQQTEWIGEQNRRIVWGRDSSGQHTVFTAQEIEHHVNSFLDWYPRDHYEIERSVKHRHYEIKLGPFASFNTWPESGVWKDYKASVKFCAPIHPAECLLIQSWMLYSGATQLSYGQKMTIFRTGPNSFRGGYHGLRGLEDFLYGLERRERLGRRQTRSRLVVLVNSIASIIGH